MIGYQSCQTLWRSLWIVTVKKGAICLKSTNQNLNNYENAFLTVLVPNSLFTYFSFGYKETGRSPLKTFLSLTPHYHITSLALMSLLSDQFITSKGLGMFYQFDISPCRKCHQHSRDIKRPQDEKKYLSLRY